MSKIKDSDIVKIKSREYNKVLKLKGKNNFYVIKGDFHNTGFSNNEFDIVYCNCIDHAWGLPNISKEVNRILKAKGFFVLEIDHLIGSKEKRKKKI